MIWMRFGTVGRMGPGIKQVVEFEDRSIGRGNLGANMKHPIITIRSLWCSCVKVHEPSELRFGVMHSVLKLLWAILFSISQEIGWEERWQMTYFVFNWM